MSYIGRDISNLSDRVKLDQISTSATATFNLTLNGNPFVPSSAESLTISLNAIIQSPQDSYTVSGSTVIFASSLQSSDVIDFILAERAITLTTIGSGTVTTSNIVDANVTTAKIADNAVTTAKLASGLALGKIGQVVTATTSTEVSNTSGTYADVGLSASITPTATSSKIYIMVSASMAGFTGNSGATNVFSFVRLVRGSTEIAEYLGVRGKIPSGGTNFTVGGSNSFTDLDSPSTTSAVTYKAQQKLNDVGDGRTSHFSFNNKLSTITLMEVLA